MAFTVTKNGEIVAFESHVDRWCGFHNEAIQAFILKKLRGLGVDLDPYDGADISNGELMALRKSVSDLMDSIGLESEDLGFSREMLLFYSTYSYPPFNSSHISPRGFAVMSLGDLLRFIDIALSEGERLVFVGD